MDRQLSGVTVHLNNPAVSAQALHELYTAIGWNASGLRSPENCGKILANSWCYVSAHVDQQLVGFGRILADGVFGQILDIMVLPGFRRQGIGTELVRRLVDATSTELVALHLIDGSGCPAFYERCGFVAAKGETVMYR